MIRDEFISSSQSIIWAVELWIKSLRINLSISKAMVCVLTMKSGGGADNLRLTGEEMVIDSDLSTAPSRVVSISALSAQESTACFQVNG